MNACTSPTFWRFPFDNPNRVVELELEPVCHSLGIAEPGEAAKMGEVESELPRGQSLVQT